jgi:hypothetical protein
MLIVFTYEFLQHSRLHARAVHAERAGSTQASTRSQNSSALAASTLRIAFDLVTKYDAIAWLYDI